MANSQSTVGEVVEGIVGDVQKLIEQQFALMRREFRDELEKARGAALSMGAGVGLLATSGILSTLTVVEVLHEAAGLPRWACYGLVAGGLGLAGAQLLSRGATEAADLSLIPHQAVEAVKESVETVREHVTAS